MAPPVRIETRHVLVNALSNLSFFVTTVAVVFFVSPILVHGLGDGRYGAWLLVNSVLAYMTLADLGVGASVVRYISRFEGLGDDEATNRIFSTSLCIFAGVGMLLLPVTLALAYFWTRPFGIADDVAGEMRWLLAVLGGNLAVGFPLGIYKSVLMGLGRYPAINALRITTLLLRNVLFVVLIHYGGGLRAIGIAITVGSLLDHACSMLLVRHYVPALRFSLRHVDRNTLRNIRSYSAYVFLEYVAFRIVSESNPIIVGTFLTPTAVTTFGIGASLSNQAGDGLRTAIAVLTPTVSKWDAMGAGDAISRVLLAGTRYVLFLAVPILVGLAFLGRQFLALWMGPQYAETCYPAMLILVMPMPIALAQTIGARILQGKGTVAPLFWLTLVQGALTVAIGVALVRPFGIEGVAWGSSIALTLQSLAVITLACRNVGAAISTYLLRAWMLPALAALVLVGVATISRSYISAISHWGTLCLTVLIGLTMYFPLVVLLDSSLRRLLRRLSSLLISWSSQRFEAT